MKDKLKYKIEAVLFASGRGVEEEKICELCECTKTAFKKAINELVEDYEKRDSSLLITQANGKWKINVREEFLSLVRSIVSETELPRHVLRTLAMIAYKSPVLQADIIHARGQSAYEHIQQLVDDQFVTKEKYGRSFKLKVTDKFFRYFDVEGDLEIQDVFKQVTKAYEGQQKLGDLDVVDAEEEEDDKENPNTNENTKPKTLEGLEITDATPIGANDHNSIFEKKEGMVEEVESDFRTNLDLKKVQVTEEEKREQKSFLDEIESQIESISGKMNKDDEDEENPLNKYKREKKEEEIDSQNNEDIDESENEEETADSEEEKEDTEEK